jgi:DNA-binding beta-propeller fold protein YncE
MFLGALVARSGAADSVLCVLPGFESPPVGVVGEPVRFGLHDGSWPDTGDDGCGSGACPGERSCSPYSLRIDFGDGGGLQEVAGEFVEHVYERPGHFTVVMEASGEGFSPLLSSAPITVLWPVATPAPSASSPLAASPNHDRIYAAMPDFDGVAVVDVSVALRRGWIPACSRPRALAHSASASLLLVACEGDDRVLFVEPDLEAPFGGEQLASLSLPRASRPVAVVLAPDDSRAWVALQSSGEVAEISMESDAPTLLRIVPALPDVRGLAWTAGGLLVSRHRSPDDHGEWAFMPFPDLAPELHALDFDPGPDSDTGARGVPTYLQQVSVSPDGRRVVFPGLQANIARGLFRDGLPLTHETTARSVLRVAALVAGESGAAASGDEVPGKVFDDRDMAASAVFSPGGDWLYVAHPGAGTIDVLDAYTLESSGALLGLGNGVDALLPVPTAPDFSGATRGELWALASLSRELLRFRATDWGPPEPEPLRISLLPPEGEALPPEVLLGKQLFHAAADPRMSRDGYLSCASCHLDGDHDGRTWDFTDRGEGLRNTIPLLGRAGTGHGPIHWSANFDEVQDFENDIRGPMQGAGFLSDEDWAESSATLGPSKAGRSAELDALAAYVESLGSFPRSPFRPQGGQMSPDAVAGEALFLSAEIGCADCHPPPDYTDSAWIGPAEPLLHDVGTLGEGSGQRLGGPLLGIDTPTLRGVWASAPYLHDGSAPTLEELLIDHNPDDLHGSTSQLGADELGRLVQFLLEIE